MKHYVTVTVHRAYYPNVNVGLFGDVARFGHARCRNTGGARHCRLQHSTLPLPALSRSCSRILNNGDKHDLVCSHAEAAFGARSRARAGHIQPATNLWHRHPDGAVSTGFADRCVNVPPGASFEARIGIVLCYAESIGVEFDARPDAQQLDRLDNERRVRHFDAQTVIRDDGARGHGDRDLHRRSIAKRNSDGSPGLGRHLYITLVESKDDWRHADLACCDRLVVDASDV